jgi:hypothetical protein
MPKLKRWGVTPDLFANATLTELLDGHTVGIHVEALKRRPGTGEVTIRDGDVLRASPDGVAQFYRVWVQDRHRIVTPDQHDLQGVAAWARAHAAELAETLGPGIHFGEWWGYKVCRGYGLPAGDRRFSLFNTARWRFIDGTQVPSLYIVPILWEGPLGDNWGTVMEQVQKLEVEGSAAVPGYRFPEGVMLYHAGADTMMKHHFASTSGRKRRPTRAQTEADSGLLRAAYEPRRRGGGDGTH